jgi:hypothetical protein
MSNTQLSSEANALLQEYKDIKTAMAEQSTDSARMACYEALRDIDHLILDIVSQEVQAERTKVTELVYSASESIGFLQGISRELDERRKNAGLGIAQKLKNNIEVLTQEIK